MEKLKTALLILICILGILTLSFVFMGNNNLKEVKENIVLLQADLEKLDGEIDTSIKAIDKIIGRLKVTDEQLDLLAKERNDLVDQERKRRKKIETELAQLEAELEKSKAERKKLIEQAKSFEL